MTRFRDIIKMMDFCQNFMLNNSNRYFITSVVLYDVFKTRYDTYKASTRISELSRDLDMTIKSTARGHFELLWPISIIF